MLRRIDAETPQLDEPLQRPTAKGVEQIAQGSHIDPAVLLDRAPVADLGGTVKNVVNPLDRTAQRVGVAQVAADDLREAVEQGGVAAGTDKGPDTQAAR